MKCTLYSIQSGTVLVRTSFRTPPPPRCPVDSNQVCWILDKIVEKCKTKQHYLLLKHSNSQQYITKIKQHSSQQKRTIVWWNSAPPWCRVNSTQVCYGLTRSQNPLELDHTVLYYF